jgi:hypothetical protein
MSSLFKNMKDNMRSLVNRLANKRGVVGNNTMVSHQLTIHELQELMKTGIYRRIVDLKSGHSTKNGFNFADDDSAEFYKKHAHLIKQAVRSMVGYGRGIVLIVNNNLSLMEPLDLTQTYRITAFDGDLTTAHTTTYDLLDERYLKPEIYNIRGEQIHYSRVVDFTYIRPPELDLPSYHYGGISEGELIYSQLLADGIVQRAVPALLEKSSTLFYKLTGFKDDVAHNDAKFVDEYFTKLEEARSIYGAGIIDGDDSVEVHNQSLSNLSESDLITLRRIALVTGIPLTILLGEGAKGLKSQSDTEKQVFNETIETIQSDYILKPLGDFMQLFGYSKPEIIVGQNISAIERAKYDSLVLDNAIKLYNLGEDASIYLNERGIINDDGDDDVVDDASVKKLHDRLENGS